jgi:D-3-phosphoglycerate dehydrogenase
MINATSIAKMKPGARIINAARGALINEGDLAQALKTGQVAGAALDVYEFEPPPHDHPLIGLKNVVTTPHLAASTSDAQINVGIEAAQLVLDALTNRMYQNVVNPEVLGS